MPTITYNIPIGTASAYSESGIKTIVDAELSQDRFISIASDITPDINNSKWGHSYGSNISYASPNISVDGDGVFLTDDLTLSLKDGAIYIPEFQKDKMHFNIGDNADLESVVIYKRINRQTSIYKSFKYSQGKDIFTYQGIVKLPQEDYDDENGEEHIDIAIDAPLEYARINQFKYDIKLGDYQVIAEDYNSYLTSSATTLEHFLDKCEYISYTDSNINEVGIQNFSVSFQTKYFPIHTDLALIVQLKDNSLIQIKKDDIIVNQYDGTIEVPSFNIGQGQDLKGFYIFYGILPAVKLDSVASFSLYKELDPSISLNLLEPDTFLAYSSPRLTNQYITFNLRDFTEYAETNLYIPPKYDNWFIEADANIAVNGEMIKSGEKLYLKNKGLNNITVSAPHNILDLVEPLRYDPSTERYHIKNYISGNLVSVFGKFQAGDHIRMSHISFSRKMNIRKVIHSYGYGKGPYSFGAYSSGSVQADPDPRTNLLYQDNAPEEYFIIDDDISFEIEPQNDGYSFHLPACTTKDQIRIYELLGKSVKNEFNEWEYHIPDAITLNPNKVRTGARYMVVFKPLINPLLTTLYINSGTFKSASLAKASVYSGVLQGLFTINSKQINFKFGTKLENGSLVYFKPKLRADMIITQETLLAITSKFKNLIF